jgi:hypothetical protein
MRRAYRESAVDAKEASMRIYIFTVLAVVGLTGCSLTSGIVPIGPNTYVLSEMRAPVRGGGAEAQRVVLAEADGFCRRQGRDLVMLDLRPDGDPRVRDWPTQFDATFQCLIAAEMAGQPRLAPTSR